jgi:hypothetical protein
MAINKDRTITAKNKDKYEHLSKIKLINVVPTKYFLTVQISKKNKCGVQYGTYGTPYIDTKVPIQENALHYHGANRIR